MCGIAVIVDFGGDSRGDVPAARSMLRRLGHRGPDHRDLVVADHVVLAHTRLAMVDVEGGKQPMRSQDGRFVLVYNGELHHHERLRAKLPGPWRTRSDTETLLRAWETWGPSCVHQLDGMFAFFIWDTWAEEGWAVRDRLGVKPLWMDRYQGRLRLASELTPLLHTRDETPSIDIFAVTEALVAPAWSGVERTPFEGLEPLLPGHILHVSADGDRVEEWWSWTPCPDRDTSPEDLAQELREALEDGVAGALQADVELGLFFSGGLDSTAVAALARAPSRRAWTLSFEGEEHWEEGGSIVLTRDRPVALGLAEELDLDLRRVQPSREHLRQELRELAASQDLMVAWEQELSQRALARAASAEVKGVLVGDAADETHLGYRFFLDPTALQDPMGPLRAFGCVPLRSELVPDPQTRINAHYRGLLEEWGARLDTPEDRVLAMGQLVVRRWLPRLLHNGDLHTMAFGLEARVPFCGLRLLELAQRVPPELALAGGVEKALLRESLRGAVPERIRRRPKSALPKEQDSAAAWKAEGVEVFADPHPLVRALVDLNALRPLLDPARTLSETDRTVLFRVLCLHHWSVAHRVEFP